jgi:hypothetical protein
LILSLDVARPVRADLLAEAMTVGTRFCARELLEAIFQEEMVMLKEASFITEWIEEAVAREAPRAALLTGGGHEQRHRDVVLAVMLAV